VEVGSPLHPPPSATLRAFGLAFRPVPEGRTGQFGRVASLPFGALPALVPVDFGHGLRSLEGADFLLLFINKL
jgi:hypothetical protein